MPTPRALPGLGIYGFWPLGSDSYKDQLDAGLRMVSALTQLAPLSMTTALPGSPAQGQIYIVPSGGDANKVALYDEGAWVYLTPQEGWRAWVRDLDKLFTFDGAAWVEFASGGAEFPDMTGQAGKVLAVNGTETGVEWVTDATGGGGGATALTVNTQTASYTLVLGDGTSSLVRMNVAGANDLTVPANATVAFPVGTVIQIRQAGAGQTTVVAAGGVTVNTPETLKLRKQGSSGALVKVGTNEWDLTGDLEIL